MSFSCGPEGTGACSTHTRVPPLPPGATWMCSRLRTLTAHLGEKFLGGGVFGRCWLRFMLMLSFPLGKLFAARFVSGDYCGGGRTSPSFRSLFFVLVECGVLAFALRLEGVKRRLRAPRRVFLPCCQQFFFEISFAQGKGQGQRQRSAPFFGVVCLAKKKFLLGAGGKTGVFAKAADVQIPTTCFRSFDISYARANKFTVHWTQTVLLAIKLQRRRRQPRSKRPHLYFVLLSTPLSARTMRTAQHCCALRVAPVSHRVLFFHSRLRIISCSAATLAIFSSCRTLSATSRSRCWWCCCCCGCRSISSSKSKKLS